ncbi:MAG TPA: hypothetical protein VIG68_01685 [Lysobacter sp.]
MDGELLQGDGFSVRIERQDGYLRAHVFGGRDSLEVSIAMWTLIAAQCRRLGERRLLVVEDLESALDVGEVEQLVEAVIDLGFRGMQVAFVDLRQTSGATEHGEILAVERGVSARVFSSERAARNWLHLGDTPGPLG